MANYENRPPYGVAVGRAGEVVDAGLRAHMLRVYNYMTIGLGITGVVAWAVINTSLRDLFFSVTPGSGLGLSLVKHIVVAHQGKITVRSKPGEGSVFMIQLPIADQKSQQQADSVNSESGLKSVDGAGYKLTG